MTANRINPSEYHTQRFFNYKKRKLQLQYLECLKQIETLNYIYVSIFFHCQCTLNELNMSTRIIEYYRFDIDKSIRNMHVSLDL